MTVIIIAVCVSVAVILLIVITVVIFGVCIYKKNNGKKINKKDEIRAKY